MGLLSQIFHYAPKSLTLSRTLPGMILARRVGKIPEGPLYHFCNELLQIRGGHIEAFSGQTVLSLIKKSFPKPPPKSKRKR